MTTTYRLRSDTDSEISVVDEGDTKPSTTKGLVPMVKKSDGSMGPQQDILDFGIEVSKGNIAGHTHIRSIGYNNSIGTTIEDITETGLVAVPMPSSALAMEVLSSSASDVGTILSNGTATGGSSITLVDTGATFQTDGVAAGDFVMNDTNGSHALVLTVDSETQITFEESLANGSIFDSGDEYRIIDDSTGTGTKVVEIHGLDSNWNDIEEYIVLNGASTVATANNYLRINNMHSMFVGTNGVSIGTIDVRQVATPANIMDRITAGGNMSLQAYYTVPNGKTAYITDWTGGSDGTKAIRYILRSTTDFSDRSHIKGVFHFHDIHVTDGSPGQVVFTYPYKVPQRATIKVSGNAVGGNGAGGASFGLLLVDN